MDNKLKELLKVSDPNIVINKARKYFNNKDINLFISTHKNKKYQIYDPLKNKMVHFGDIRFEEFTKHKNKQRQQAYLKRSTNIKGNWKNNLYSPNNLSINLLWN